MGCQSNQLGIELVAEKIRAPRINSLISKKHFGTLDFCKPRFVSTVATEERMLTLEPTAGLGWLLSRNGVLCENWSEIKVLDKRKEVFGECMIVVNGRRPKNIDTYSVVTLGNKRFGWKC
jgi:hypothetical protein